MTASDKLLLQYFFEDKKEELHLSDSDIHQIMHLAAFFSIAGFKMKPHLNKKPVKILAELLKDEDVKLLAKCNEYQDVVWYNKELMQLIIVLSALSAEVMLPSTGRFSSEKYISVLLEKESESEYKLDRLLEE